MRRRLHIRIRGIVQGVGFRPFVYRAAESLGIAGSVSNDTEGVIIDAEGDEGAVAAFLAALRDDAPPLSRVMSVETADDRPRGIDGFLILPSGATGERSAFYSPDAAVCPDCLAEFFDPGDRRHHYPFITCINCGPRFSIVTDIPYDRPNTTMEPFPMCPLCRAEYENPHDRRFHSQPNACPACGPRLSMTDAGGVVLARGTEEIAEKTVALLRGGGIGAIKGMGGYHLAADATLDEAVRAIRDRKRRPFKPFALMAGSVEKIASFCDLSATELALLVSPERPIVLLGERERLVSRLIAPGLSHLGVMLPCTPFQHHLFSLDPDMVLVMTSGNISDEPIEFRDASALARLGGIAGFFVAYNREIAGQTDDSVVQASGGGPYFIRRSRGYVPAPHPFPPGRRTVLAMGGDIKNSFAVARRDFLVLSQYLGDMADLATFDVFMSTVRHFIKIFDAAPDVIVSDLHPGYLTRQYADELAAAGGAERLSVQHHHAHAAAVMAEHGLDGEIIGVTYDGTGYGADGTLWGGEILVASRAGFRRAAHLAPFMLPGGESAIRDVWKTGLSLARMAGRDRAFGELPGADLARQMLERNINCPLTSSAGRLFDGVAALLGLSLTVSAEAEAAQLLEEAARRGAIPAAVPDLVVTGGECLLVDTAKLVDYVIGLAEGGASPADAAMAFHEALAASTVRAAVLVREATGIDRAALSGGTFHNRILLDRIRGLLSASGFRVYVHESSPCNDGCIALGQAAVARALE